MNFQAVSFLHKERFNSALFLESFTFDRRFTLLNWPLKKHKLIQISIGSEVVMMEDINLVFPP